MCDTQSIFAVWDHVILLALSNYNYTFAYQVHASYTCTILKYCEITKMWETPKDNTAHSKCKTIAQHKL